MATISQSTVGNVTTFVIEDVEGNTLSVAATANGVNPVNATFTSSGSLLPDGLDMLTLTLMPLLRTGVIPTQAPGVG